MSASVGCFWSEPVKILTLAYVHKSSGSLVKMQTLTSQVWIGTSLEFLTTSSVHKLHSRLKWQWFKHQIHNCLSHQEVWRLVVSRLVQQLERPPRSRPPLSSCHPLWGYSPQASVTSSRKCSVTVRGRLFPSASGGLPTVQDYFTTTWL